MTKSKLILATYSGALIVAVVGFAPPSIGCRAALANDIVVAADDDTPGDDDSSSDGSAKMGTEEGTHVGDDQGSAPENDTDKIDQPPRRNPTTSNAPDEEDDDVMPPDESEDGEQPE